MSAYNSKVYYVQGCVLEPTRIPITGHETILDAINFAGGLTPEADHTRVVLYRQPPKGGELQALHVDIDQIMIGDDLSTNYQLMPGDRLVVPRDATASPKSAEIGSVPEDVKPSRKTGDSHYFGRQGKPAPSRIDQAKKEMERFDHESLIHMSGRLKAVEEKLDLILEAVKAKTP